MCVVAEVIRSYIIVTSFTEIERPTRDTCFISSHPLLALPYGTIVCRQGGQLTILELYNYLLLLSLFSPVLQLEVNNHNLKLKLKNSSYNYNILLPHIDSTITTKTQERPSAAKLTLTTPNDLNATTSNVDYYGSCYGNTKQSSSPSICGCSA